MDKSELLRQSLSRIHALEARVAELAVRAGDVDGCEHGTLG